MTVIWVKWTYNGHKYTIKRSVIFVIHQNQMNLSDIIMASTFAYLINKVAE